LLKKNKAIIGIKVALGLAFSKSPANHEDDDTRSLMSENSATNAA
jgi:hypothetical protein